MTFWAFSLAAGLAVALSGCRKEEKAEAAHAAVSFPSADSLPMAFAPPAEGLVEAEQVKRFLLAHDALARVNEFFLDSLAKATDPKQQRALIGAMDIAREKVTRKYGLAGYAEYRWMLEEAPKHPENLRLLEQMQVIATP